jgi:hypothetical protein
MAVHRENTGVGRFTKITNLCGDALRAGHYGSDSQTVDMSGVDLGLDFFATVQDDGAILLEIVTADPRGWDGIERPFLLARN